MKDQEELLKLQDFAGSIVRKAGELLIKEQKKAKIVDQKDILDVATTADINSEKLLIDAIQSKYPDHNIISEEAGKIKGNSDYTWYIDPLDGTKEYVRNIPLFNSSILLELEDEPIVSAVYRPTSDTLYSAARILGSTMNGEKISTTSESELQQSMIYAYPPSFKRRSGVYDAALETYKVINSNVYRLRYIQDENTALCWLAHGGHEAYLNLSNPPKAWHDIGPGYLIAKEAGAIITTREGKELSSSNFSSIIAASNSIFQTLLLENI